MTMKEAINALLDFYAKQASNSSIDYTYGFMDAIGVLRDLEKENAQ